MQCFLSDSLDSAKHIQLKRSVPVAIMPFVHHSMPMAGLAGGAGFCTGGEVFPLCRRFCGLECSVERCSVQGRSTNFMVLRLPQMKEIRWDVVGIDRRSRSPWGKIR